jgi:Fe-Mn family superoxide dismutase
MKKELEMINTNPYKAAGFNPLLVMDVWEHAYLLDYKPADRRKHIEGFSSNIDWNAVETRLNDATPRAVSA